MTERLFVRDVAGLACHAVSGLGCGSRIAPLFTRIADLAPDAMTDHVGELVRFADRGQAADVRARLAEFGYDSEVLSGAAQATALEGRWYAPGDLSREEAQVLAGNITPAFALEHGIAPAQARALEERVRSALFDCFTGTSILSAAPSMSMPGSCREAVAAAAADSVVDAGAAAELGALVERRLFRA